MEREAIVIYLRNLSIVLTIIHHSQEKRKQLNDILNSKQSELNQARQRVQQYSTGSPQVARTPNFVSDYVGSIFGMIVMGTVIGLLIDFFDHGLEVIFSGCITWLPIGALIGLVGGVVYSMKDMEKATMKAKQDTKNNQQQWNQEFENAKRQCAQLEEEYNRKSPVIQQEISMLDAIISQLTFLRDKMYALNIIPSNPQANFRTFEGVLYLFEFMDSSRESLETAMKMFKLDEIRDLIRTLIAHVENVISNQKTIMWNQDNQMKQIKQNGQRMGKAMEEIRDYEEIIAHNSALQTSLADEALYYQKLRFWADI